MNPGAVRFEGGIGDYLERHFLRAPAFAAACGIEVDALHALIAAGLAPAPAYVAEDGHLISHVFGRMPAPDAPGGAWFARGGEPWVRLALEAIAAVGPEAAGARLRGDFERDYRRAMRDAHAAEGPIPGFVREDGTFDEEAFDRAFADIWRHFLAGTFALCVRDARDVARIADKEILQLRLAAATDNGAKRTYTAAEAAAVRALIARYVEASMPFSPVEYARSSRRRLVADILPCLDAAPAA